MTLSRVDQYIVYHEKTPLTVWAYKSEAILSSHVFTSESGLTSTVFRKTRSGAKFLVHVQPGK